MNRTARHRRGGRRASIGLVLLALVVSAAASPIIIRHDRDDAAYRALGARFSAMCHLNLPDGEGTLIAPRWVLTAAHVGVEIEVGHEVTIAGSDYAVVRTILHPDWDDGPHDLALLELEHAVTNVDPVPLYRKRDEVGQVLTVLGRGDFGTGKTGPVTNDGHLRGATNRVDGATAAWLTFAFDAPGSEHVTELEGISGPGDSGGPGLLELEGSVYLAGVSSAQSTRATGGREGVYGVTEYYTRVSSYLDWIDGFVGQNEP